MFWTDNGPRVFGMVDVGIASGGLIQYLINYYLLSIFGYANLFYMLGGLSIISFIVLMFFDERKAPLPRKYLTPSVMQARELKFGDNQKYSNLSEN